MVLQGQAFHMYASTGTLTRVTAAQPSSALRMSQGCEWRYCLSLQQVRGASSSSVASKHVFWSFQGSSGMPYCPAENAASALALSTA